MKYTVYIYGCATCGMKAYWLNKFHIWAQNNDHTYDVINTKYEVDHRKTHASYLPNEAEDAYFSVAVEEGTNKSMRLEDPKAWI